MIRVAFTLIGGRNWTGGYNYLLNLVQMLCEHTPERIRPVIFFGADLDEADAAPFKATAGASVLSDSVFNESGKGHRLRQAVLIGRDRLAEASFRKQDIDVAFEPAQFYGWRFPIPAFAWIPDFQHRHLPHLFDARAYWKREIGFRAQVLAGREIMLSSEDARQDCEKFYPSTKGRTHVVRFAVPATPELDAAGARAIADSYGLPETFFFLPNQFWKHKNHACVVEALRLLKAQGHDVVVAASGKQADPRDPAHFPRLAGLVEKHGLAQKFRLLGLIPHAHIAALMRACAALINPSTFEGWSTTVEEAKAMGTPMILSSLRVHREQGGDAQYFDPESPRQLADLLQHFVPLDAHERQLSTEAAARRAVTSTRVFAQEFAAVAERTARHAPP